ncbi:uncharacterized protein LOC134983076 [Pseudophryne corroboree]|uniref:uncharacterized protein LOC134983076 n=1 Tax=Pseudophryne corroboree TaxID=495146 RepID=UPI0030816B99
MENHRPLTSLDGSSNRKILETYPHTLYSQDCTEETCSIPQEDQGEARNNIKVENIEGEEKYVIGVQEYKEEETSTDVSTDWSSNRSTPERCPRPLYSQDHAEESHSVPQEDQGEYLSDLKVEDIKEEEETYVRSDQQCKEEEIPTDISTDGASNRNTPERCPRPLYSQDHTEENHSVLLEDQGETSMPSAEEAAEPLDDSHVESNEASTLRTKTKTGRNVKFTYQENIALVTEVMKSQKMLFGRQAARTTAQRKSAIWAGVVEAVNAKGHVRRNEETCKKRFSDIKRRVKLKMAKESRIARQTGVGFPHQVTYLKHEVPLKQIIPPEVIARLQVIDTDAPRRPAHQRQRRRQLEDKDEEEAGPSSAAPLRRSAAVEAPRISLAASGKTCGSRSPHLVGSGDKETEHLDPVPDMEPVEAEERITLQIYPLTQPMPATPTVETPQPQISPSPPPSQPDSAFWHTLSDFQTRQLSLLTTQVRQLSNLSKCAHRRNRGMTALTAEVTRVANNLDQIRDSSNRFQDTFLRMIDSQTNAARDLNATILSLGTQLLARLPDANSGASPNGTTHTATPVATPQRRTVRTRGGAQQRSSGREAPR